MIEAPLDGTKTIEFTSRGTLKNAEKAPVVEVDNTFLKHISDCACRRIVERVYHTRSSEAPGVSPNALIKLQPGTLVEQITLLARSKLINAARVVNERVRTHRRTTVRGTPAALLC